MSPTLPPQGRHWLFALAALLALTGQAACLKTAGGGDKLDDGVVITERVDMFNSTALVNSKIGQLRKGDKVAIYHQAEVNGVEWAKVQKEGESKVGWIEARHIVLQRLLDACRALEQENIAVQPQIGGRLKRETRLRVQPSRDSEVITVLKSGTEFDILKRRRVEQRIPVTDESERPGADENDVKYDTWYLVRFPENSIYRIGWLYGGSVELIEPPAIAGIIGGGRRIAGAIPFGTTLDKNGIALKNYFILDKQIFSNDPVADFDRIYVVRLDPKTGNYTSAYYESPVRGLYPVAYQNDSDTEARFFVPLMDKNGNVTQVEYTAGLVNNVWVVRKGKLPPPAVPNRRR
ncbi:MAG: SH3 domain-containing protein [Chloracidobacterium sp.]|nr:SH3 domain-containing protein [Chloracidobacterium sp.]MDW8218350.1 SH3 domain-containing protein [Acidobacteriota bacterium]